MRRILGGANEDQTLIFDGHFGENFGLSSKLNFKMFKFSTKISKLGTKCQN